MILSPAWKEVDKWLINQDKQARLELAEKSFQDMAEVNVLQERIRVIKGLQAHIKSLIRKGHEERAKMQNTEQG